MLTSDSSPSPGPTAEPRDLFDARQLWQTIRQHSWLVAGVGVAVFLAVMAVTLVSRMQFRSVARLYLGELESLSGNGAGRAQDELELSAANQGVVGSEIEIIQSRSLVARAALDSGLNVSIVQQGQDQPRYWKWLLARRDPALLDRAALELRAEGSRLTDERALERAYALRFSNEKDYEVRDEGQQRLAGCVLGEACKVPGAELRLVRGSARAPSAGSEYAVVVRPLLEVVDAALKSLQVTSPKPTPQSPPVNVVALEFSSSSPAQAAGFLERLIAAYLAERQSWKVEDAGAAEAFVSSQLASVRKSLDDIQQKLATYRSNNRVVVLDNEAKAMIEQIGKYEEQRVAARLETAALSDVQRTLKGPNPPVGAFLLGEANDTVLEGMAGALSTARQKLTDLESRFNDAAPEIRDQRSQVEAQLESIRNYVSSRAARARENLGTLDGVIAQYEKRLKTVPGAELGLAQLSRESEVYSRTYSYLLERQQQTAIIKASTLSKNRVLDAPQLPHREDSPKLLLRLASAPLGLLVGVLLVLGRSRFAGTLQSEGDARSLLGGVNVLGIIPRRLRRRGLRPGLEDDLDVIGDDVGSRFVEAFRSVRAKLYRSCKFGGQALLLSSPTDRDGKTTCALGLAALLAADGKRVVVIDANLRKPGAAEGSEQEQAGLSTVLRGEAEWTNALELVTSELGQFYFMPAAGPAPAELLSSKAMSNLLDEARKRCDFVLLDAPSFPAVSDALVLSGLVDVVLSVLRPGQTQRKAAVEHLQALRGSAPVFAVVLNDVGFAPSTKTKSAKAKQRFAAPVAARLLPKGRTLALWIGALLLLTAGVAARFSQRTTQVIESVVSLRHAG
jgi:tyrosine-protein kinase Etk/Wzc